ncbi:hypothetical protein [Streptomyces prasinopilosus]|uniref:hypothetical protein n=1 Tax=Streptomyces prasinopilosus TaxID=67344 RepID=UPI0006EB9400|nr:hypothetical protein [Streptomyces prasinopilosus]
MAFPDTPLDSLLEILVDGQWLPVPTYNRDRVQIETGRREGATVTDPGSLSVTINNRNGRFSPRNAESDLYGRIGRNTRCRLSVADTQSFLELDGVTVGTASTPDHAALDITGDLDLRWEGEADWYAPGAQMLIGKWGDPGDRSYHMRLDGGSLWVGATINGTTGHVAGRVLPPLPRRAAVRVTIDVNDGSGNSVFRMYWAPGIDGPWTQISDPVILPSLTIFPVAAPLTISPRQVDEFGTRLPVTGRCYRAQVRAGINGTIVADPDFTTLPAGTLAFTDAPGRPWTVTAAGAVRDRADLFVGEISEWPQEWTPDGADAWVPVQAAGILRRLGQGRKALQSTLRRRIPSYRPLAYWPMEEGANARYAYSPIERVPRLQLTNANWAAADSLPSSEPLPTLKGTAGNLSHLTGLVFNRSFVSLPAWSVQFVYRLDEPNESLNTFLRILSMGSVRQWYIQFRADLTRIIGRDQDGEDLFSRDIATGSYLYGQWVRVRFQVTQEGGNVRWRIVWTDLLGDSFNYSETFAGNAGRPTGVTSPPGGYAQALNGMAIGHIGVFDVESSPAYFGAIDAWTGESAWERMYRLAGEEGLRVARLPGPETPQRVGPQTVDTLLNLLQAAADADGGMLLEDRRRPGLLFRERSSLYNQTPKLLLSYAGAPGLAAPLRPVDDDAAIRNDRTVKRDGGSEGRAVLETGPLSVAEPPAGLGRYDDSVTLSLHDDAQAEPIAHWRLHLGTHDGPRYPQIRIMLHKAPALIPAALTLTEGDLVRVTGLPKWAGHGDVDLIVEGIRHEATLTTWDLILTCSPGRPWRVGTVGAASARADTDGSQLVTPVGADATILTVQATAGPAWITSAEFPSEFPFDVRAGGEVMTVTAVADAVTDTFGRTAAGGWGTANTGQPWTLTGGTATDYAVGSGVGTHTMTTVNISRRTLMPQPGRDFDLQVDMATSALSTGGHQSGGPMARATDGNNLYQARLEATPAQGLVLTLRKRVGGTETVLATATLALTHTAGTFYRIRFQGQGSTLQARAWRAADPDPGGWQVAAVDGDLTAAGEMGVRSLIATSNTNTSPVIRYDNFRLLNPQWFTVTRSVNGVRKPHPAGTAVGLASPAVVAL